MVEIFALVPDLSPAVDPKIDRAYGPFLIRTTAALRPVAQVCRTWRFLFLTTTGFWTSVASKDDFGCAFPSRPGSDPLAPPTRLSPRLNAPLHGPLYVHFEAPAPDVQCLLIEAGHRVEELHVATTDWRWEIPLWSSFRADALERLVVQGAPFLYDRHVGRTDPCRRMLFGGHTPRLRTLVLLDLPYLPANSFMTALSRLVLVYRPNTPGTGWPLSDVLGFLSDTPALNEACIVGPLLPPGPRGAPLTMARLDVLQQLSIAAPDTTQGDSSINVVELLLSHLILPAGCSVHLRADGDHTSRMTSLGVDGKSLES